MGNDYIDKFGGDRKYVSPEDSKRIYVPIAMGAICVVIYAVYLWSAFNSRSAVMALLFFCADPLDHWNGLLIYHEKHQRYPL
ncbi:MAG: hypothetical protein E7386_03415 [Ruminococcaceae bacterium]|nr:hypothetical protein [Oscillospiraceae bacterium]